MSSGQGFFQKVSGFVVGNQLLREPQREAFASIQRHFSGDGAEAEVGIVLPVGCGKSGLIAITPFAVHSKRVLVVAPGLDIADQLHQDVHPKGGSFYTRCKVIADSDGHPEPAEIRGGSSNIGDLEDADIVVTNIHQLQGQDNRWISKLGADFFDLILFDEAHHNVADSWDLLRQRFKSAKFVGFSATPTRADGQLMRGRIIYSFPIRRAIECGYVKRLKATMISPEKLVYVRRDHDVEIELTRDEVVEFGEQDSDFRRSVVQSDESLATIVDASIQELLRIRKETQENRHKIIASALNRAHCVQIKEAFASRGYRAEYAHSVESGETNRKIKAQLAAHELDVIVQVRMLGEGFDHKYLSVAAVCSIFANLSPFVQFVGRVMRVVDNEQPDSPNNQATVVFHAGANVARRWSDFQQYSEADKEFFDALLPLEVVEPGSPNREFVPGGPTGLGPDIEVSEQFGVSLADIPLLNDDVKARQAISYLASLALTAEQIAQAVALERAPTTKQSIRRAKRVSLDEIVKTRVTALLNGRKVPVFGKGLDRTGRSRQNFVVMKSEVDGRIAQLVGRAKGQRGDYTRSELESIEAALDDIISAAEKEVFRGSS
jgi:superfamily II DNA or RNA helicase